VALEEVSDRRVPDIESEVDLDAEFDRVEE
jgi:hypothetical protein